MNTCKKILALIAIAAHLCSCSNIQAGNPNGTSAVNPKGPENSSNLSGPENDVSPFTMFENLKETDGNIIDGSEVDNILKAYGIHDKIAEKLAGTEFAGSDYTGASISGFAIGSKKAAIMLLRKGHLHIYIMFSKREEDKWNADGFACHNERFEPEYRIEHSDEGEKYWLVIRHESNHGTGLQIFDETWYNPDGSVAAQYPAEGSVEFFPQNIEPAAYANFSAFADYDGKSTITVSYSVNFEYGYKESYKNHSYAYRFKSSYSPAIREYWKYDMQAQQFSFVSCSPDLPENFGAVKHESSPDLGILVGYIDFYRYKLGNGKITTLEEWESFIGQIE